MLKFTPKTQNRRSAKAELFQRIQGLDNWQARLVLSFIDHLFDTNEQATAEREAAA